MMVTRRRATLAAGAGLLAAPRAIGRAAAAQAGGDAYPNRTIRFVVPFAPGGTTDIIARLVAERLTHRLGQHVLVENRAGATGNVGTDAVAKAPPDGYTLLMCAINSSAINYSLYGARMPYKPEDLSGVGLVMRVPNVIFVTNDLPVRTLRELVDYVKARPGQLNYGSAGVGASLHLTGEVLKGAAGPDIVHVAFRGAGPMVHEVMAGRVHVAVDNLPSVITHLREGRLRALAVTTAERSPALPDVPTAAEAGYPQVEAIAWFGVQAPARTPRPVVERLGAEIDAVVKEPETRARIADLGGLPPGLTPDGGTSPEAFERFVRAEIARWAEVVHRFGATVE